ncbi:MAG: hypothetical protein Fur006_52600 [Coleofasciculaceae cyanobacterium]
MAPLSLVPFGLSVSESDWGKLDGVVIAFQDKQAVRNTSPYIYLENCNEAAI